MDLAICPSCGQSVLDDDAENCPFCGASMSGKPGASKPAAKPAGKPGVAAATAPPVRRKPGAAEGATDASPVRRSPAAAAAADDPDAGPITADTESAAKAIPVRSKRVKGLVLRVKCPMCETEGWVPAKAAGREVRCANKDCLVPIFNAPELPKKPVEEPKKARSKLASPVVIVAGLAVVALGAFGIWYAMQPPVPEVIPGMNPVAANNGGNPGDEEPDDRGPVTPVPKDPTVEEIRVDALQRMIELAQSAPRTEKPTARQRAVVAHARLGQLPAAREQLERLENLGSLKFFEVDALAELGWAHLRAGDQAAAAEAATQGVAALADAPRSGRSISTSIANLAALLHAVGRTPEVAAVLEKDRNDVSNQRTALRRLTAIAAGSYDFDAESRIAPFLPPANVAAQLVTAQLAGHGRWDDAASFAAGRPKAGERGEALALVAELLAARAPADAEQRIAGVAGRAKGAAAGLVLARVAVRRLASGDVGAALPTLAQAVEQLPKDAPAAAAFPDAKAIFEATHGFANETPFAPLAAAEVARARALSAGLAADGDREAAWEAYAAALRLASAAAPPFDATSAKLAAAEREDPEITSELAQALNADSGDEFVVTYRENLRSIDRLSHAVRDLKAALLADAARHGFATQALAAVTDGTTGESPETMYATALPIVLRHELSPAEAEALPSAAERPDAVAVGTVSPEALLAEFEPPVLAGNLSRIRSNAADEVLLRLASFVAREKGFAAATDFLAGVEDPYTKAEAAMLVEAAEAAEAAPHVAWKELVSTRVNLGDLALLSAIEGLLLATETPAGAPPAVAEASAETTPATTAGTNGQ